jgi:proteasome lid subunit RPN8/RPN11
VRIPRAELAAVESHAREGYPYEVCGALLGPAGRGLCVTRTVRLENREAEAPRVRYAVAPLDLLRVYQDADASGLDVLGFYHSHPDHPARPSETDRSRAAESISEGVVHMVVGIAAGDAVTSTAWVFREGAGDFEPEPIQIGD